MLTCSVPYLPAQAVAAKYPNAIKIRMVQDNLIHKIPVLSTKIYRPMKPWLWQNDLSFTTLPNQPVGSL